MAILGAHVSVAGGLPLAVTRARALGCDAFQIFSRNASRWHAPPLDSAVVRAFRQTLDGSGIGPVVAHASYLVNLAAAEGPLREQSLETMADELGRADALGLLGVVLHPGSAGTETPEVAIARVARAVRTLLQRTRGSRTLLLLEHTAGQGRSIGHRFEHLQRVIAKAGGSPRLGICLDTCHLLAAGYDIASADGYEQTFADFDRVVGLERLRIIHVNDSKRPCGSRIDRHAHIGEGFVGIDAFARLVNDPRLRRIPMLLETEKQPSRRPADTSPDPWDIMNLTRLRRLLPSLPATA
jgi:deoxyribonuclease-4